MIHLSQGLRNDIRRNENATYYSEAVRMHAKNIDVFGTVIKDRFLVCQLLGKRGIVPSTTLLKKKKWITK
jgi:hypothetical protein